MSKQILFFVLFFLLLSFFSVAEPTEKGSSIIFQINSDTTDTITTKLSLKKHENKKVIAAIFALPLPFGILGLHRIYLGTKPYIPFVYIGTIGGCFLILPFIDFCYIIFSDDETFKQFSNNPKVFMWSR
ncbi:MAG: TM2 domain-containing protein [Bacteroidota bacterium]